MARATEESVRAIIETDDENIPDLSPYIEIANELVTEVCASALNADGSAFYSSNRLTLIERWLSAHFYAIRDPRRLIEQVDTIREQIESKVGIGLDQTRYGQQVKILDTNGGFAILDAQAKSGIKRIQGAVIYLGSNPCQWGD